MICVAEKVKLNKNGENMHNYLSNGYLANIKWLKFNLKIKWFLFALMQFLLDLSIIKLIISVQNSFILHRNEKNQA